MSKRSLLAIAPVIALALASFAEAEGPSQKARLVTFDKSSGGTFFALSLKPDIAPSAPGPTDVVILFDTSASQTGLYREDALTALQTMLGSLNQDDRVKLIAVDLNAVSLTDTFVSAGGEEIKAGLAKLRRRVPLGSTDMATGLRGALQSFGNAADRQHAIVYMGDGMSKANLLQNAEFSSVIRELVAKRAPVSSYAIGPQRDMQLLAAVANLTGGNLFVDSEKAGTPQRAGQHMATSATGTVFWPKSAQLPASMQSVYPKIIPPLRTDRDSILVGSLKSRGELSIGMDVQSAGKQMKLSWQVSAEPSNADFGYLPQLVEMARDDRGLSLTTLGMDALKETGRAMAVDAANLAKVSMHALRRGDVRGALSVADAALQRDPQNPQAVAVRQVAARSGPVAGQQATGGGAAAEALPPQRRAGDDAPLAVQGTIDDDRGAPLEQDPGGLLNQELANIQVKIDKLRVQVENGLRNARRVWGEDAATAKEALKLLLEDVERAVDVPADIRSTHRRKIEIALREASVRERENVVRQETIEAQRAAAEAQRELTEKTLSKYERVVTLMKTYKSLMMEEDYLAADAEIAKPLEAVIPNDPTPVAAVWMARNTRQIRGLERFRDMRHKNFADVLYEVEEALIPFPATPPIMYPDADVWVELSLRRKKYASIDLAGSNSKEQEIFQALDQETTLEFFDAPLREVVDFLKQLHKIPIYLDAKSLEEVGLGSDTPVTQNLTGISLRSGLRLMLGELGLTYVIKDEVLKITTPEQAEAELITKVYPVGDLVLPILTGFSPLGGQGGGGGQGQGGGGGGFGGQGGGGGGFGGQGGGGGGGFFDVEDDLTIGDKKKAAAKSPAPVVVVNKAARSAAQPQLIPLPKVADDKIMDAWSDYFAKHKNATEKDMALNNRRVRRTAVEVMAQAERLYKADKGEDAKRRVDHVIGMLYGALRHGQPQPWMYEALVVALQINQTPVEEVERALMSVVDFSNDPESIMMAGLYMRKLGLNKRALQIFKEVSAGNPYRPEPYIQGLAAAQQLNDIEGQKWACVGILSQAWTKEQSSIATRAKRIAHAILHDMRRRKQFKLAKAFEDQLEESARRDCKVVVRWTGGADVDIQVQEPSGSICSLRNPRTTAGGVMLGDTFSSPNEATVNGFEETYECPQGFSGTYRVLIRRVWGKVTAGKVSIDIYARNKKAPRIHKEIDLAEKDALVAFDVEDGRRHEHLAQHQIEVMKREQEAVGRAMLAQQQYQLENSVAVRDMALQRAAMRRFFGGRRGAVGFRPVITLLPEGTNLQVQSVIVSPDRRYVRVGIPPFPPIVSGIGEVNTFNFATGEPGRGLPDDDDANNNNNNN